MGCIDYKEELCVIEVGEEFFSEMEARASTGKAGEVVMVVPRKDGEILLHTKEFYPNGIYRLPTGKLQPDEDPDVGFLREFQEELGQQGIVDKRMGALHHRFVHKDKLTEFVSYIYLSKPITQEPVPEDEEEQISGFKYIPVHDLNSVAAELRALQGRWTDWGCFRAEAHAFVARQLVGESDGDYEI